MVAQTIQTLEYQEAIEWMREQGRKVPDSSSDLEKGPRMEKERFIIKQYHLDLLKQMNVSWGYDEFGAPEIDPKRPYGDSSNRDILNVIAQAAGYPFWEADDYEEDKCPWNQEEENHLRKIHRETEIALQICLKTGKFEKGTYECNRYFSDWHKIG